MFKPITAMELQVVIENHAVHSCDDIKFSNFCTVCGNEVKLNKAVALWMGHSLDISVIFGTYHSICEYLPPPVLSAYVYVCFAIIFNFLS